MSSTCILTDSAAQYPQYAFSGKNDVRIIPFSVELNGQLFKEGQDIKPSDLPSSASEASHPRLVSPSVEEFQTLFTNLSAHYHDVIAVLTSSSLCKIFENAQKAAELTRGKVRISIIDSQTTSLGLGLLVQKTAEMVARGLTPTEIERQVRSLIPRTYMTICTPSMSYLYYAGYIDQSQAFVGEMLGIMPVFTLEEGELSPVEKIRNMRGLIDYLQEFVLEFDQLEHIAFIQSQPAAQHEAKLMREHAQSCFPQTPFTELNINVPLATLFGPRTLGLVAIER